MKTEDPGQNDRMAGWAEEVVCEYLSLPFEACFKGPDRNYDIPYNLWRIDVKWIGPEVSGYLVKPEHKPWGHCDMYVAVGGSTKEELHVIGWCYTDDLRSASLKDFQCGQGPQQALHTDQLRPMRQWLGALNKDRGRSCWTCHFQYIGAPTTFLGLCRWFELIGQPAKEIVGKVVDKGCKHWTIKERKRDGLPETSAT